MNPRVHIKCIFLAEFHHVVGPTIVGQFPEGYFSSECFNQISDYIIPKPSLCDRLTAVRNSDGDWVLGHPVRLRHEKFKRTAVVFNVCFVVAKELEPHSFVSLENLVAKVARYVLELEIESEFLTSPTPSLQLGSIFGAVFENINANSFCVLPINKTNVWHLKLDPIWKDPPQILDHEVPVPIIDFDCLFGRSNLEEWDLSIRSILPHINGSNHLRKIAQLSNQDCEVVRSSLQHLVYYNCICMSDVFQYSNMYRVTQGIRALFSDPQMQEDCVQVIILSRKRPPPPFTVAFGYYCKLQPGTSMHQLSTSEKKKIQEWNICLKKLIVFGILNGFVERVHKYPLLRSDTPLPLILVEKIHNKLLVGESPLPSVVDQISELERKSLEEEGLEDPYRASKRKIAEDYIQSLISAGNRTYDELLTQFELTYAEVDQLFSRSIYK